MLDDEKQISKTSEWEWDPELKTLNVADWSIHTTRNTFVWVRIRDAMGRRLLRVHGIIQTAQDGTLEAKFTGTEEAKYADTPN